MPTAAAHVALLERLAKTWLVAPKKDTPHPGWEHAQDVVEVVRQVPGVRPNIDTQLYLDALAWGHDLLTGGIREDGGRVTEQDLRDAGVQDHVVLGIRLMTRRPETTAMGFWRAIDGAPELIKIVHIGCVIAHLHEGAQTLDDQGWSVAVSRARRYEMPHTHDLGMPWREWLQEKLDEAMSARPTVRIGSRRRRT